MANLQHLIVALGKVADAYAPDPNDDPDASDKDPEDDPGNDDGDPLDDPRSYSPDDDEADRENAEDKDGDDEDDFSRPKIFSTVMLLQNYSMERIYGSRQNGREEIRRSFDTMPDLQLLHRARRIRVALNYCDSGKRRSRLITS
jgi:hypothetical protein